MREICSCTSRSPSRDFESCGFASNEGLTTSDKRNMLYLKVKPALLPTRSLLYKGASKMLCATGHAYPIPGQGSSCALEVDGRAMRVSIFLKCMLLSLHNPVARAARALASEPRGARKGYTGLAKMHDA